MSIATRLPIRIGLFDRADRQPKPARKHRAVDKVDELEQELAQLRRSVMWANLLIKTQRGQLNDADLKLDAATERADIAANQLAQAEEAIRLRDRTIAELQRRLDVGVKAEHVVAATQELDCRDLRERFADGPVRALNHSPMAAVTDPGHI